MLVDGETVVCIGAAADYRAGGEGGHASAGNGGRGEWRWMIVRTVTKVLPGDGSFVGVMVNTRDRKEH